MNYSKTPGLSPAFNSSVGKGIKICGEITGSESLQFDGELEGSINLDNSVLIVGANAKVNANISAKQIVVQGQVNGNVNSADTVEIRSTAAVQGEIVTSRLIVEEGAVIKGRVAIKREERPIAQAVEPERPMVAAQAASQGVAQAASQGAAQAAAQAMPPAQSAVMK